MHVTLLIFFIFFFFNDTATTEIYTLSLHDALPNFASEASADITFRSNTAGTWQNGIGFRSEEHTSELQSHSDLVCRLLLEKKKKNITKLNNNTRQKTLSHTNQMQYTHHPKQSLKPS